MPYVCTTRVIILFFYRSRFDFLKHARNLAGVSVEDEEEEEKDEAEKENAEENMDVQASAVKRPGRGYKDQVW